jgi:hypothetical protein
MQCIGVEADVRDPDAEDATGYLVRSFEVSLERQSTVANDQHGMNVGARAFESIGHPAEHGLVDVFVFIG